MRRQTADFAYSVVRLFSSSHELQRNRYRVCRYVYRDGKSDPELYRPRRVSKSADIEFARRQRSNSGSSILAEFQSKHSNTQAVLVTYWNVAAEELQKLRESPIGGMGHACELETSLVLAIKPGLVRTAKIEPDGMGMRSRFLYRDMLVPGTVSTWGTPPKLVSMEVKAIPPRRLRRRASAFSPLLSAA